MRRELQSAPGIYLVGLMGAGKTSVGRRLAARLGWEVVDLDAEVERKAGAPIRRIFEQLGEPVFRRLEHEALVEQARLARAGRARVVALGGGAFVEPRNRQALAGAGLSVWLDAPVETLWQRVGGSPARPLARDRAAFERLYELRRESYSQADLRAEAQLPPEQVVETILETLRCEAPGPDR